MFRVHIRDMRVALSICLLLSASATRAELSGPARVIDGDTLRIGATQIRLHGIDAPEATQTCAAADGAVTACGALATRALAALTAGAQLSCTALDVDRYGRTVARCTSGGRDLGRAMVEAGHALAYRRYSTAYVGAEDGARQARRGLWSGRMQDPAAFRASRTVAAAPAAVPGCAIKGNISGGGRIYHVPGQEHYAATRINTARGERWFCTEAEARAAGWRAARR